LTSTLAGLTSPCTTLRRCRFFRLMATCMSGADRCRRGHQGDIRGHPLSIQEK
jgi:hypothetical protein